MRFEDTPEVLDMMHVEEPAPIAPTVDLDSIVVYGGALGVVIRKRGDEFTVQMEDGSEALATVGELYPLSDEELEAVLVERRKRTPIEDAAPKPHPKKVAKVAPPGGHIPAPSEANQADLRAWGRRWSRSGLPQATISVFSGFVEFVSTILDRGATLGEGNWAPSQFLVEGKDVTSALRRNIELRIERGAAETYVQPNDPSGIELRVHGCTKTRPMGKRPVGRGVVDVTRGVKTFRFSFAVFKNREGYRVAMPAFKGSNGYVETLRFRAWGLDLTPDVRAAVLLAWARITKTKVQIRHRPAPKGRYPRACGSCRHYGRIWADRRSSYDIRENGVMAPTHFCFHPKRMEQNGGNPVPLDTEIVRLCNESLSRYGRNVPPTATIWMTPSKRGIPQSRQNSEPWDTGCARHCYRGETDDGRLVFEEHDGKEVIFIEVVSRPPFDDHEAALTGISAEPTRARIPITF